MISSKYFVLILTLLNLVGTTPSFAKEKSKPQTSFGAGGVGNVKGAGGVGNVKGAGGVGNVKGAGGVGNVNGDENNPDTSPTTSPYNGAGGQQKKHGWIPFGIGKIFDRAKWTTSFDYEKIIEKHHILLRVCRGSPTVPFMTLPGQFQKSILLLNSQGNALDMDQVCRDRKIFYLHEEVVVSLLQLNADPLFRYLVEEVRALTGNPLKILLTNKPKRFATAQGGSILETSWFEHETNSIYLAPEKSARGIGVFFRRGISSLIMHELTHVFTHALYGGYKKVPFWHDVSKPMKILDGDTMVGSNLYRFQTSEYAAWIESISNLAESGLSLGHPMIAGDWEGMNRFHQYKNKNGEKQSFAETWYTPRFRFPTKTMLANEAYVTSSLHLFVQRVRLGEDTTVQNGTHRELIRDLFKVLRSRPSIDSVIGLFEAYDHVFQSQDGWRFLQEFFLWDYKSRSDIRTKLIAVKKPINEVFFTGRHWVQTGPEIPADNMFSVQMENREHVISLEAARRTAIAYPKALLIEETEDSLKEFDKVIPEIEKAMPAFLSDIVPLRSHLKRIVLEDEENWQKEQLAQASSPDKIVNLYDSQTLELSRKVCVGLSTIFPQRMCEVLGISESIENIGKGKEEKYLKILKEQRAQLAQLLSELRETSLSDPLGYQKLYEEIKRFPDAQNKTYRDFSYAVNTMHWLNESKILERKSSPKK